MSLKRRQSDPSMEEQKISLQVPYKEEEGVICYKKFGLDRPFWSSLSDDNSGRHNICKNIYVYFHIGVCLLKRWHSDPSLEQQKLCLQVPYKE